MKSYRGQPYLRRNSYSHRTNNPAGKLPARHPLRGWSFFPYAHRRKDRELTGRVKHLQGCSEDVENQRLATERFRCLSA